MQKISKKDIVKEVSEQTRYSQKAVSTIIDALGQNIAFELSHGRRVRFAGFGTFEPKKRAPRTGRNPHTNKPVYIPARIVPVFTPGDLLKELVIKETAKE